MSGDANSSGSGEEGGETSAFIAAGDTIGVSGTSVALPITFNIDGALCAFQFTLVFDGSVMSFDGFSNGTMIPEGWFVDSNPLSEGEVVIGGVLTTGSSGWISGEGVLI